MVARPRLYDQVGRLFAYPVAGYTADLEGCAASLGDGHEQAAAELRPLLDHIGPMSLEQIQELYTCTFDINPVCTLEVGWHIYGEDYARGAFLVKMREMLRRHNLPESTELPDHLTHVLSVLGRLHGEEADDLAARYVLPSLEKMLTSVKDSEAPYMAVLKTVVQVVRDDHEVEAIPPREKRTDPPGWKTQLPVYGKEQRR